MKKITLFLTALSFSMLSFAQVIIKGIVESDSIPLESASVIIKNSTKGVATNEKGEFKLKAKEGDTLSVSYLGYETKDIVVNDARIFKIKLEEGGLLDTALVIGYMSTTKYYSKGCCCWTTSVKNENLLNRKVILTHKLFPNPSSNGKFQLKLNDSYDEVRISIANINGQIIKNSTHQKFGEKININLSQFAKGIYIINIIADDKPLEAIKAIRS